MKKILYTRPDGGVSVVIPAAKKDVEKVMGPLTEEAYEAHVRERSIPESASNVRDIDDADLPESREFRNAWVDVTAESRVDVDCAKARDIAVEQLRLKRKPLLEEQDKLFMLALERGESTDGVAAEKQRLRDVTEPLKSMELSGVLNDEATLAKLRELRDALN